MIFLKMNMNEIVYRKAIMILLIIFFFDLQIHISCYLHYGVIHKDNCQRIHSEQLHVFAKSVELVRFYRYSIR